ncbi:MarR family winged helix-turn-helix transcriptional regulator [Nocardioides solisilvae]|uniref:MarR family winged helix-turn-helix transcriptional regulator n=1 Tax=Nocardioides solisilvae TaxID=1542435 RepID=UPI001EF5876D|nr:MarR family transcriptional regulator [Nocardioides solisilvae]
MDTPPSTRAEAEGDLAERLMRVARLLRRRGAQQLEPWDLSPHQVRALRVVEREDGPRLGRIADELRIAPRSTTDVVDALEGRGLVERYADPADRRASCVRLTDAGAALLRDVRRARATGAEELFAVLDAADRQRLADLLARVEEAADQT